LNSVPKIHHQQSLIIMHLHIKIAMAFGSQKVRTRIDDPSTDLIFLDQFVWLCIQITSTNSVNYHYDNDLKFDYCTSQPVIFLNRYYTHSCRHQNHGIALKWRHFLSMIDGIFFGAAHIEVFRSSLTRICSSVGQTHSRDWVVFCVSPYVNSQNWQNWSTCCFIANFWNKTGRGRSRFAWLYFVWLVIL
jgi:hypothetical protein